jgi:hypothetical protein
VSSARLFAAPRLNLTLNRTVINSPETAKTKKTCKNNKHVNMFPQQSTNTLQNHPGFVLECLGSIRF